MYITAHRILTEDRKEAINSFLHETGHVIDYPEHELETVESNAGKLIAALCDLPPGRNHVMAYLDIIAPDEATKVDLLTLRKTAQMTLHGSGDVPLVLKAGRTALRFGCVRGYYQSRRFLTEFDLLWNRSIELFSTRPLPPWMAGGSPLIIREQQIGDQLIYSLDDASQDRVQARKGIRWGRRRFTVDIFDQIEAERALGDLTPSIISAITGLDLSELMQMGGVKIIHDRTDRVLYEYP